jgi:hypothetical protein
LQHPAIGAHAQPVLVLHESVVHTFPSEQSAAVEQQPAIGVCVHACVVVLHA